MSTLPPVFSSVLTPLSVDAAFDLFFRRLSEWWPLGTRSVTLTNAVSCEVETRVGGRFVEHSKDGQQVYWGTILVWEPPFRAVFTWHPGAPETMATEVEVKFTGIGQESRVEIEHRNWERLGPMAREVRALYDRGWTGVLRRFEERSKNADLSPTEGPGCMDAMKKAANVHS